VPILGFPALQDYKKVPQGGKKGRRNDQKRRRITKKAAGNHKIRAGPVVKPFWADRVAWFVTAH